MNDSKASRTILSELLNGKKKEVSAHSLTNFSRNSPTFPHLIINKEGGNRTKVVNLKQTKKGLVSPDIRKAF